MSARLHPAASKARSWSRSSGLQSLPCRRCAVCKDCSACGRPGALVNGNQLSWSISRTGQLAIASAGQAEHDLVAGDLEQVASELVDVVRNPLLASRGQGLGGIS
jgi:hypothetical protein